MRLCAVFVFGAFSFTAACTSPSEECAEPSCDPADPDDPDDEVEPPSGDLERIPPVPFDYELEPGEVTSNGELPASLGAGEVHMLTEQAAAGVVTLNCQGTEEAPAFILGGRLHGDHVFNVTGSWCVFDGVDFDEIQPRTSGDHIVFRGVEVHGSRSRNGMNLSGNNVVVVDSEIHHHQANGRDAHGVQVGVAAEDVWLLGNHIHHNSGNGFQACHNCDPAPSGIFIGNNLFHSDREVAVGLKYADNVIIEGNIMHSYVAAPRGEEWCFDDDSLCGTWTSGSDGSAIVVGADGAPSRVVVIRNEMFDVNNAVRIEDSDDVEVVGNDMHDLGRSCLALDKQGEGTLFQSNTCANAPRGIYQNWRENFVLTVEDNQFTGITEAPIEYESGLVCNESTLSRNTFTSTAPVVCGNTVAASEAEVNALPGASENVFN